MQLELWQLLSTGLKYAVADGYQYNTDDPRAVMKTAGLASYFIDYSL